jgi:hypothetical protein
MATKKNPSAVKLGKLGGEARAEKLSREELSEQGRNAVLARWAKAGAENATEPKKRAPKAAKARKR